MRETRGSISTKNWEISHFQLATIHATHIFCKSTKTLLTERDGMCQATINTIHLGSWGLLTHESFSFPQTIPDLCGSKDRTNVLRNTQWNPKDHFYVAFIRFNAVLYYHNNNLSEKLNALVFSMSPSCLYKRSSCDQWHKCVYWISDLK